MDADGYSWYQLASLTEPTTYCEMSPTLSLEGCGWFGWAAAKDADAEQWIQRSAVDCPAERTTAAYLAMAPSERLVCAGDEQWELKVYIAPLDGGRGCFPIWVTSPAWLDANCNFFLPQPVERELDEDGSLQAFIHPDIRPGSCPEQGWLTCMLEDLRGRWIVMTGHLDDPAAKRCKPVLTGQGGGEMPSRDEVAYDCRLRFVVTKVRAVD